MRQLFAYVAAGAFLAPLLLLASDILLVRFISEAGLMTQRIALSVFIIAIAGVAVYARGRAPWQIRGGAALAILGALGGDVMVLAAFWTLGAHMLRS